MTDIDTSINACAAYSAPIAPPTSRQVSVASTASSIGAGRCPDHILMPAVPFMLFPLYCDVYSMSFTATGRRNTYVLIHNVSHSDVVLGINSRDMSMGNGEVIADLNPP